MAPADRYDLVAVSIVVTATLVGGLVANAWGFGFLVGACLGNGAVWGLRRRAGLHDRSPLGAAIRTWQRRSRRAR